MEEECVLGTISLFVVSENSSREGFRYRDLRKFSDKEVVMKAVTIAVFKEFQSVIVSETKIEQVEGFIGHPAGYSIMLAFKRADTDRS